MFPGRYAEIFGLGERLGCIMDLGGRLLHATCGFLNLLVGRYASSHFGALLCSRWLQPINHCELASGAAELPGAAKGSLEKA